MNKSKNKFCINLAVAVLFLLSFLFFGMNYFVNEIENSSAKIVEGKKSIYTLSSKNGQISNDKKQYKEIETEANKVFASILDKGQTVAFITEAEKAAAENRLKMRMAVVADKSVKKEGAFITSSSFNFTVGGDFNGLMHFLYSMENLKYDVDIEKVSVNMGDFDQYNKDMIILTFDLKLYQKNIQK